MTGYGEAHFEDAGLNVAIEVRAVNNRYLKVSVRAPEPYNLLEPEFERVIRRTVRRGTLQVSLRCERQQRAEDYRINATALTSYLEQLQGTVKEVGLGSIHTSSLLGHLLILPGVVAEPGMTGFDSSAEWPVIERVLAEALGRLQTMRQEEGRAMAREFLVHRDQIADELNRIRARAPAVVSTYRDRVYERVRKLLSELDIELDRSDLIKEVSIFAERSDIAEEVMRLGSHLDQFQEIINAPDSAGRKLEFLTQEMFREANTIGSKASDVEISRYVVEIKGALERIRELVQNVE
jgi:uncharacterized protein (TIGR00255 family)